MKRRELLDLAKQLYTEDEIFELELAIDFATHAHYGQKRRALYNPPSSSSWNLN